MRLATLPAVALITTMATAVHAESIVFDDGGTHTFDGAAGEIRVTSSSSSEPTTLTIVEPANVEGHIFVTHASTLIISGGEMLAVTASNESKVQITGGQLQGFVVAANGAEVEISGGEMTPAYA